jgi:uncharacterized repeat protein (TIGR02543 family)
MKTLNNLVQCNRWVLTLLVVFSTSLLNFSCEEKIEAPKIQVIISPMYNALDKTSGEIPVDPNKYLPGAELTLLGNTGNLTKTGSVFKGWTVPGSTNTYVAGDKVVIPTTHPSSTYNVTVKWAPVFSVTYNGNGNDGGTAPTDANLYEQGATVTVGSEGTLTKAGFAFSGWNTAANGSGTARGSGSTFNMGSANVVLYAQWVP